MAGFKIHYRGCDGKETFRFATLAAVARYVKGRDMGPDYRRGEGLQGEFAFFTFDGFTWADVLDGERFSTKAKFKAALVNDVKLSFRDTTARVSAVKLDWIGAAVTDPNRRNWDAKDGPETVGTIEGFATGHDPEKPFTAEFTKHPRAYSGPLATLADAKKWLTDKYVEKVKIVEEPAKPADGYDPYWDS